MAIVNKVISQGTGAAGGIVTITSPVSGQYLIQNIFIYCLYHASYILRNINIYRNDGSTSYQIYKLPMYGHQGINILIPTGGWVLQNGQKLIISTTDKAFGDDAFNYSIFGCEVT